MVWVDQSTECNHRSPMRSRRSSRSRQSRPRPRFAVRRRVSSRRPSSQSEDATLLALDQCACVFASRACAHPSATFEIRPDCNLFPSVRKREDLNRFWIMIWILEMGFFTMFIAEASLFFNIGFMILTIKRKFERKQRMILYLACFVLIEDDLERIR